MQLTLRNDNIIVLIPQAREKQMECLWRPVVLLPEANAIAGRNFNVFHQRHQSERAMLAGRSKASQGGPFAWRPLDRLEDSHIHSSTFVPLAFRGVHADQRLHLVQLLSLNKSCRVRIRLVVVAEGAEAKVVVAKDGSVTVDCVVLSLAMDSGWGGGLFGVRHVWRSVPLDL